MAGMFKMTITQPSVWQPAYQPRLYPLTVNYCPISITSFPHFPPFTSFILFQNLPASWDICIWVRECAVNGVLTRLWTDFHNYPHQLIPHIDILPTPFWNIFLECDFFSLSVPLLCLTCLPSLNQHGWLDNFTRSFMPKGTQEREI